MSTSFERHKLDNVYAEEIILCTTQIVYECYQAVARTKDINSPAHLKYIPSFQIQEIIKDCSQFDAKMGVGVENWELPRTF